MVNPRRRHEDIVADFTAALWDARSTEARAIILLELEVALKNHQAQEWAELNAYCICPNCSRIYTEAQFSVLAAPPEGLSRRDEYELTELRECEVCQHTLVKVLQVFKARPAAGVRVHLLSKERRPCCHCRGWAEPGEVTAVVQTNPEDGRVELGSLCDVCEAQR